MKYFEDFDMGELRQSPRQYTVTEEEIIEFGNRWDFQPFHVDPEAAKQSPFGGLVASSTHLFSIAVSLWCHREVGEEEKSAAISALGFNNMKMKSPARPGDVLRGTSTLVDRRVSRSRPEAGILTMRNAVLNQRDDIVLVYEHAGLYLRRP
jgi:acyl dehydratase